MSDDPARSAVARSDGLAPLPSRDYHALTCQAACAELSSPDEGLSDAEAARRLHRVGPNELRMAPPPARWKAFLRQFRSAVVLLLLAAAIIAAALGEWIDSVAILAIVTLNGMLGFIQEDKSQRALDALRNLSAPEARVLRQGQLRSIPARELVPGDRVRLESGDHVPADARLIETARLATQEAPLTGESLATEKKSGELLTTDTPLADRVNMVYSGTTVSAGNARALVVATGMDTELGHIAGMLERQQPQVTPLERRLDQLGKTLMLVCLALVGVIASLQLWRGNSLFDVFLNAVSLAVAAVPEGLPAVVTTALALGLQRMVKRHALIRKLPSVETLGSVTIICSDKTGTLTRNQMTLRELVIGDRLYLVSGEGFDPRGEFRTIALPDNVPPNPADSAAVDLTQEHDLRHALLGAARCTTARLNQSDDLKSWTVIGDPTEGALLTAAAKAGVAEQAHALEVLHEIPFEPERKLMSIVVADDDGRRMFTKGAPEVLLLRTTHEHRDGLPQPLDDGRRKQLAQVAAEMAGRALRVLAVATRTLPPNAAEPFEENQLSLLAIVGLIDPPRDEARQAVKRCQQAGIRPIMITGDHPSTAAAIARELGISPHDRVLSGSELDRLDDAGLQEAVASVSLYARVSPEHKERIVHALQARGEIVAMTGDGVNDAPAIAAADIGIAMGITGTDVTKGASDMVLTDDNFASIVNAVEEGRGIFDNIQRSVHYLLATNAGEVLFMLLAAMAGWPLPLLPVQLLWMNLITDGLPALTLGMERPSPDIMTRPPRDPRKGVISARRGVLILVYGCLFALVTAIGFYWVRSDPQVSLDNARTVAFCTLALAQVLFAFGCRHERLLLWQLGATSNRALLAAIAASVLLQIGITLFGPAQRLFGIARPTLDQAFLIMGLALVPISVLETLKIIQARFRPQPVSNLV